jgi:hypothetical protein
MWVRYDRSVEARLTPAAMSCMAEITLLGFLQLSVWKVHYSQAEILANILCSNTVSQLIGLANTYRRSIHPQSETDIWKNHWAITGIRQHTWGCMYCEALCLIVTTILLMQWVAIAGTFGSAVQHTSDPCYCYYFVNTETNHLLGLYGASSIGWTGDTMLVYRLLHFLDMILKGL